MIAIENSGLLNLCYDCGNNGLVASLNYAYDGTAKTVKIDTKSTFPAGDSLEVVNIIVHDRFGKQVTGQIKSTETTNTLSTKDLNPSEGLSITACIVSKKRLVQDLAVYNIGSQPLTGVLGTEIPGGE
ncbi:hypothetical protein [Empedobacter falsenii]|uniref:hypothetical protein n=1 Tax=Empedobacter falsenii TaxID=343874 RepID=UPI003A807972